VLRILVSLIGLSVGILFSTAFLPPQPDYFYGVLGAVLTYGSVVFLIGGVLHELSRRKYGAGIFIFGVAFSLYGLLMEALTIGTFGHYEGTGGGAAVLGLVQVSGILVLVAGALALLRGYQMTVSKGPDV
jgi:ACR3 family arsenite efflux pump ArsB